VILLDDLGVEQVICADDRVWVPTFTGLSVRQFRKLVRWAPTASVDTTSGGSMVYEE
jgi:hypothetical protein